MLERVAAWFLNTYVAEYVGNLNTDQLSIGLLSGAVELEKLTLKKDALHKLKLPIEVKAGYIGKLRLKVPVRYIKSQPWIVEVDQLYIIAGPPDLSKFNPEEEKAAAQSKKLSKLAAMEQKWREEQQGGKSSWFWSSFAASFSSTVAENLQVTINNIHVRYEDTEVGGANPLAVGLIIEQIAAKSTNQDWEPQFSVGADRSHKAVDISNLSVYWDTELLGDLQGPELLDAMLHKGFSVVATGDMMSSSAFLGHTPSIQHLVKPFSATAQITRNCSLEPLKISNGPRVNVNVIVEEVPIVLSENQFIQFVKLSDLFQMRWKSQKYRELRPRVPVLNGPRIWWQFAIHSVSKEIKEHNKRLSMSFVLARARQCVSYVSAYTIHLTSAMPSDEVREVLKEREEEMSYEELAILRRVAMQRVEKERALAEEAKRIATTEVQQQQGYIGSWLPGWISGYPSDPGGGGSEEGRGGALDDVDEEELMDELGLEMDPSSKLLRDRIFAVVSFNLKKGSLNLVTEEDSSRAAIFGPAPLLELELSNLSCHVDYRPRLKYSCYELQLGGVYVQDHYHDESQFSALVQPKLIGSSSSRELLRLQLIQQDRPPLSRGYNLHVVTHPLEIIYNQTTVSRLKQFFALSSVASELSRGTSKVGGAMGGVDPKLLDSINIKLDISAPHIVIPENFEDPESDMIIVDLGHLDFESVSNWSEASVDHMTDLKEHVQQDTEDSFLDIDIDDDDEFVTPPSSPPSESEWVEPSEPITPTTVQEALKLNIANKKLVPLNKYLLKLSDIQLLVGKLDGVSLGSKNLGSNRLHLLDRCNLLVKIERNSIATVENPFLMIEATLPHLNFHVDEHKVRKLLTCLAPPPGTPPTEENCDSATKPWDHVPVDLSLSSDILNATSVYHSAYNVFADKPTKLKKQTSNNEPSLNRSASLSDSAHLKLVQGKMCIERLSVDLAVEGLCFAELTAVGIKAGVVKKPHDISLRVILKDLLLVDKMAQHDPQYELILCSDGKEIFSNSPTGDTSVDTEEDDIFSYEGDFLVNILFDQCSSLSMDYPRTRYKLEEPNIRKLAVQCTAVNAIANQELIVRFISFCHKAVPLSLFKGGPSTEDAKEAEPTNVAVPMQTEISVEFEKFCLRMIRGPNPFGPPAAMKTEANLSSITAVIELDGVGIDARIANLIKIEGRLEGARVTDVTPEGRKYQNIVSVGRCREGRNIDMVTTMMMTSYDSLVRPSDIICFSLERAPRAVSSQQKSKNVLYDVSVSVHIPSILYTHSVNFVREMEIFALVFKQYFVSFTTSVKTAAIEVAKGLVSDESHLVHGLSRLSSTLGGSHLPREDEIIASEEREEEEVEEDVDFDTFGGVDCVTFDVQVKSPVVVVPSTITSSDTIIAHLGEISLQNKYISMSECNTSVFSRGFVLRSSEVDRMVLKISNMSLHASHDQASLDWLTADKPPDDPANSGAANMCAGHWNQILKETSFELVVERAVGGALNQNTPRGEASEEANEPEETIVDASISCSLPNSLFVSLSKQVFDQIKCTVLNGLYVPLSQGSSHPSATPTKMSSPLKTEERVTESDNFPRIVTSFSLPRLSIEFSHLIGDEERKIVFLSFEEFLINCRKTIPYHTFIDLALKTVIIEDLLQKDELFRYILSSTQNPLPFPSPVVTPSSSRSVLSHSMGISPHQFLSLSHLISSPKPPRNTFSPLRFFNPNSTLPLNQEEVQSFNKTTTPPNEVSRSSSITDIQDLVSISLHHVSRSSPEYSSKYKNIGFHADVAFSSVFLVVNLQTWVLFFDYLGIGVPTPPVSPTEDTPTFFTETNSDEEIDSNLYSLKPDGSIYIKEEDHSPSLTEAPVIIGASPDAEEHRKSTVWGVEGKISASVNLKVQSLTVTLNKPEHPLARGVANELRAEATLDSSNITVSGSLGQASLVDLTDTGAYYRERFTTTGDQAMSFEVFKFGQKDPNLERPYDISASVHLSAVRYLHTMRFLKEVIAFLTHFPQLIDAFQRMKAVARGKLEYVPDRKPRVLLEVEVDGPMILIPKHAFSPEIMGGVIKKLTLCNKFLYDRQEGTLSQIRGLSQFSRFSNINDLNCTGSHSFPSLLSSLANSSLWSPIATPSSPKGLPSSSSFSKLERSKVREDQKILEEIATKKGPCLLDCIELVLSDVDVFSARKTPLYPGQSNRDGTLFQIQRDDGKLLKEKGTLKLQIERNLYEDFCRDVPDIHIDGTLSAVHLMLDKRQLEIIKGLIDLNLGEDTGEFEKPSTVIHDPIAQHVAAAVWTGFRFHIEFVGVQLEFLRSRPLSDMHLPQSLALFDIKLSEFTFESHSDQSKTVDFTNHAVIGRDTRYEGYSPDAKPNVFEEVLKFRQSGSTKETSRESLQVEIHVTLSPTFIKASILLNSLRLIGVIDLLLELKKFVIDKLPEEDEEGDNAGGYHNSSLEEVDGGNLSTLRQSIASKLRTPKQKKKTEEKKPDRDVTLNLSVTETDFVVVEDLRNMASNAVVLKGTVVLNLRSPPKTRGSTTLQCSVDGLELFSCVVSNEDDTALSILDPVSVGVELKPIEDGHGQKKGGTHLLEFDVRQLNVRLSYNDIKLFMAIVQNLQAQSLKEEEPKTPKRVAFSNSDNEKLVKQLIPLGFSRSAILRELKESGGDISIAALRLGEESMEERKENEQEEEASKMKLEQIDVILGTINLCLIDDSLNHDIPLVELTLGSLHAHHQLVGGTSGTASCQLALDYYNRSISAWEPIVEPWMVQFNWRTCFSTDLDTNEKPTRLNLGVTSPEQLCVNVTSSLLHLFKETQASWQSDYKHDQNQKRLLDLHHHTANKKDEGANSVDTPATPTAASNVQQGLAFLHSVRFISQSRQRIKFIPFALRNSTGLDLSFATLTSLPSEVLLSPSFFSMHSRKEGRTQTATPTHWTRVAPTEEKPFDFLTHQKMRHKDTRALVVHQLKVKVDGWEETAIPISVDKIGIFFRDLHPSIGSSHGPVRLVFAISLSDTRKVVNVRSGLVIHNTLELPMEVKLDPPAGTRGPSESLPVILPVSYYAIPLHLTHWEIRVRPQGWGLKFCSRPLLWNQNDSRVKKDDLKECPPVGDNSNSLFRFSVSVKKEPFPAFTLSSLTPSPGHTLLLHPPLLVHNLLPYDFHFCYFQKEKLIPHGKTVPFHTVSPLDPIQFSISKLEGFRTAETCIVSVEDVGLAQYLVVCDKKNRKLYLRVKTELLGQMSLKVHIWCPYWIVNRTGLPLVFTTENESSSEPAAAGQYEEHEAASTVAPLLFAYPANDLIQKCQVRIGTRTDEGNPMWSSGFRMISKSEVIRLFVNRGRGRPDREYQIGMEIHRGSHQYNETRVVTFVARFQIENRTSFKLGYLQRHVLLAHEDVQEPPVIMPSAIMAFHWPRTDLDQLLCIRVLDLSDCHWSAGFPLEQDKSFHINMRHSFGRSVFIRCEILQRGETYHVILLDAFDYPPPFKLENLSKVPVIFYQAGATLKHMHTQLNPGQSVPYAWDDTTLKEKLCLRVKAGSEPRCFDLESFGTKGKVYYESYFYIVAMGTRKELPVGVVGRDEFVLDVPQGKAVILSRKDPERRSQLWRMTAEGHLVHIATSSGSTNYVLDLVEPFVKAQSHNIRNTPLQIERMNAKKAESQTWEFTQDGHLVLMNYHFLCVQFSSDYESGVEGIDAVLGRVGSAGWREEFGKVKQSAGSGVLSVALVADGPTRILRITDENRKYTYDSILDDWVIVENGMVGPARGTDVDPVYEERNEEGESPKTELGLSLSFDKGVGVSLINSVPEELIFASATGIRVEYVSTAFHHCLNATIQYLQVDNQTVEGYSPVLAYPSPPANEIAECNYPVISCFIERLPHRSPFAIVFRTFELKLREFSVLMEERLLFKILQWAGIGVGEVTKEESIQEEMMTKTIRRSPSSSSFPSHQIYIEQLGVSTTRLLVSMHTTSRLPDELYTIKKHLGFPLVQFESPITLRGFHATHMLGTVVLFVDSIGKHYKRVIEGQAIKILGSVDFLGNPVGLISDVASGVQGMIALEPDVVGLVRDVTHGVSDTASKLTGTVSHVLGRATGDSSYQEEREQNLENAQSSGDHFKTGLINLTGGIFGGVTSIFTQPYEGAIEDGLGGFFLGIGKGVVGTVAKPVAGLLDFASGTSAALRESLSRLNRQVPHPMRLRRCCVGATGALTCYSVQLARGEEYLMRLNDGDNKETLVSYEKIETGTPEGMRVLISSQALYFFEDSPPDPSSLQLLVKLDSLVDCRVVKAKTTIPANYIVLHIAQTEQQQEEVSGANVRTKRFKSQQEQNARKIVQLVNYAKNLHQEEKMVIRTPRLQNEVLW